MLNKKNTSEKIIKTLLEAGYAAFWAGGCVRDMLLGREPEDFDIATAAAAEEIRVIAERNKWQTVLVGQEFGVIIIIAGGSAYEVTSFRADTYAAASRRPAAVMPVKSIEEDLARRDFTINAMAMAVDGSIIDPYGGALDLEQKIIRAVGNAAERFAEDALRMFRAVRFAARFNFEIEAATFSAIAKNLKRVDTLSAERVANELTKIILSPYPLTGLALLRESALAWQTCRARAQKKNLAAAVLPELKFLPPASSGKLAFLKRTPPNLILRFTALLTLICENTQLDAAAVLLRLKIKKEQTKTILWLLKNLPPIPPPLNVTTWLSVLAQDFSVCQELRRHLFYLITLWRAKAKCRLEGTDLKELKVLTRAVNKTLKTVPFFPRQLALSGAAVAAQLGANANVKKFQLSALSKIQKGQLQNTSAALREELALCQKNG